MCEPKIGYFPFKDFPTYLEIKIYLGELCRKYPDIASIEIVGITTEMAEIYMLKLQKEPCCKRATVLIDGTIHAREWLTTATALYFINYIIRNQQLLNLANFFVIPCVNVDGYMFTQKAPCYRLWRKNRTLNCWSDVALQGVDLNRNFPVGFGMPGSSDDPGAFNYRGEDPLSEPASRALSYAIDKYSRLIKLYISLHCYGNAILYPWSFTKEPIPDTRDLQQAAEIGRAAFEKASNGKRCMKVGNSAEVMSLAAGTSTDYARFVHNIKFSYIFELQGYGKTGFTPKRRHIPAIGYETTMAIISMSKHVMAYYKSKANTKGGACDDIIIDDNGSIDFCKSKKPHKGKKKCKKSFQLPAEEVH